MIHLWSRATLVRRKGRSDLQNLTRAHDSMTQWLSAACLESRPPREGTPRDAMPLRVPSGSKTCLTRQFLSPAPSCSLFISARWRTSVCAQLKRESLGC